MTSLPPPTLFALDLACQPIRQTFRRPPYLVGSMQEGTAEPGSDVDVRMILDDKDYDALITSPELRTMLDIAFSAYLRLATGLLIDFQFQRMTEANEKHDKPRSPLGVRRLMSWVGDAAPTEWSAPACADPEADR